MDARVPISSEVIRTQSWRPPFTPPVFPPTLSSAGNERWDTDNTHNALCFPLSPHEVETVNPPLRNTVKQPLWIRKLHLRPKYVTQTVLRAERPLLGQPREILWWRRGRDGSGLRRVMTALCFCVSTRAKSHGGRRMKARAEGFLISSDKPKHVTSSRGRCCMKTKTGLYLMNVFFIEAAADRISRDLQWTQSDPDVNCKSLKRIGVDLLSP